MERSELTLLILQLLNICLSVQRLLIIYRERCIRRRRRREALFDDSGFVRRASLTCFARPSLRYCREQIPRRCWQYGRSTGWWDNFVLTVWDDECWIQHFRMTRSTMEEVADALKDHLTRKDTNMRRAISVFKRVAMTVWWFANISSYRLLSEQFAVGTSTAAEIVIEVCLAMEVELLGRTIYLGDVGKIMDGFARLGFPHCIGAIDGSRIPIITPSAAIDGYVNRTSFHSILLQGTCDHTGRFVDIELGWSGSNHDAHVFKHSAFYEAMDAGTFVPLNPTITLNSVQIPPLVVADAAYPLCRWLMKPFGGQGDRRETLFDRKLAAAHNVVVCAFRRLKARWRCLNSRLPLSFPNAISAIKASVILHNICEEKGHSVVADNINTIDDGLDLPNPNFQDAAVCSRHRREGEAVRNAIADLLLNGSTVAC